jgi:hypothetical protein
METAIQKVNGRTLLSGRILPPGDSVLTFEDQLVLRTFVISTEEDVRWNFRDQSGTYSSPGADSASSAEARSESAGESSTDNRQQDCNLLLNSEVWRVAVNVQHRFENDYEPSDIDSIRLDFWHPESSSMERCRRQVGSIEIDANTCGLRLERLHAIVVACGDSSQNILQNVNQLVGRKLLRVDITPIAGDTALMFDEGLVLRCFPATSEQGDIWRLSSTNGDEFVLGPRGSWQRAGQLGHSSPS